MRLLVAALLTVALLPLASCGGASTTSSPTAQPLATKTALLGGPAAGEVKGRLVRVGGPPPGTAEPLMGSIRIAGKDGSVTTTEVDSGGEFDIKLLAGSYTLTGTSPQIDDGKATCVTDPPTTVLTAGKTVSTDIICSIR